jgi:ABC-2 type transport system ATP-binding protein
VDELQISGTNGVALGWTAATLAAMPAIISISKLSKSYASGLQALKNVDLEIRKGEIFALLGPNGAGKTTLISIVCGIVTPTSGTVAVDGHDIVRDYRASRSKIGLVPQELQTDMFETVWNTATFSRGLFGRPPDPAHLERVLRDLSLWEKRDNKIMTLSGGMKRRVLIAKALSHEPDILFLDEPTAGVDVELRRECGRWCASCANRASPSSSRRTTSTRPRRWPTASASSTRASSSSWRRRPRS